MSIKTNKNNKRWPMKIKLNQIAAVVITSFFAMTTYASDSHYVPGIEGVKASAVPPPGVYYKGYAVDYRATKSDGLPSDSKVTVNALAHRLIWVTEQKVLGGDLTFEAILPMIRTDISIAGGALKDKESGFGDAFLGSVIGWHGERWDAVGGIGYWTTSGKSGSLASAGKEHKSVMLTYGGNIKLNQAKDISFSVLGRYEIPDKSKVDDEMILEWGLSKSYGALDVGLVGYNTKNTGGGKDKRNAVGASVGNFWPSLMLGAELAAYREVSVRDNFKGRVIRASLTKVF